MSTVEHYRDQAAQCRQLAADKSYSQHAKRWLLIAQNYELMAAAMQKRESSKLEYLVMKAKADRRAATSE